MTNLRTLVPTILMCAVFSAVSAGALAAPPKQVRFGLLPAEDPNIMVEQFSGIAKRIGKAVNLPVDVKVTESYNALIEGMRAGHLEIVYVGGSQYVKMIDLGMDVVPLALNRDPSGRTYYKSCIIAHSDSNLKKMDDLSGHTFAFVSPTSTSGGVAPTYFLIKNGINPDKDLKRTMYAGKHDAVFLAVKNKKVDAGAVADLYFTRWKERGILKYSNWNEQNDTLSDSELRLLGCIKVPNVPMVTRKDFGDEFIEKVRHALETLPEDIARAYRVWPSQGFVRSSHEDFIDLIGMKKLAAERKKSQ